MRCFYTLFVFWLATTPCFAAGPYVVDDAELIEPGALQSESWYTHADNNENVANINLGKQILPRLETTLQLTDDNQNDGHDDAITPEAKYLWRDGGKSGLFDGAVVIGGDVGFDRGFEDLYGYLPFTWHRGEELKFNVNVGWQFDEKPRDNFATWGVGASGQANDILELSGEIFGAQQGRPAIQFGPRFVVSDAAKIDLIYGHNIFGESEDDFTAGVTVSLQ